MNSRWHVLRASLFIGFFVALANWHAAFGWTQNFKKDATPPKTPSQNKSSSRNSSSHAHPSHAAPPRPRPVEPKGTDVTIEGVVEAIGSRGFKVVVGGTLSTTGSLTPSATVDTSTPFVASSGTTSVSSGTASVSGLVSGLAESYRFGEFFRHDERFRHDECFRCGNRHFKFAICGQWCETAESVKCQSRQSIA